METGDSNSRKDIAYQYSHRADPNNKTYLTCNFCGKVTKGGAYRLKQHLAGGFTSVSSCQKCPEDVKEEVQQYMLKKREGKKPINLMTDFDKAEENEVAEVSAPDKRVQNVGGSGTRKKKPRAVGPMDAFVTPPPKTTQMGRSEEEIQATVNDAYKKELREKACADIARWLYEAGIPLNAVNFDSFNVAIQSIGRYGIGMKPPSYYEVRVPLLKKEVAHIDDIMKSHKKEWSRTGCSIMSSGWQDQSNRSLISFLVNCSKGSMFIESIDASSYMNKEEKMFQLLDSMVEKIGVDNVVQVITNNDSSNEMAGRLLEAKRTHLYWTPCAAHCLDLILEDIAKFPTIKRTIKRAIELTGYIYNRAGLLNMMRRFTGQRSLLWPATTQFATSFLTLSSIHKQKKNLRKMFTSENWTHSKWAKEPTGQSVAQTILMPSFWSTIVYSIKVSGPLVRVLRLVDGEKKPAMGYIYKAMDQAKEAISLSFKEREDQYREIFEIIDRRWECQLHLPLHAAGYFLNPEYFYDNRSKIEQDVKVMSGLYKCIERLVLETKKQDKISEELKLYKEEEGVFGMHIAIRHRKKDAPAVWWFAYGASTPNLQQFAVKVLSLTCSLSRCERNWSMFEHVHSKKRSRLAQSQMVDLVYIEYNRALNMRYNLRDTIDPISLKDIDDSNEWLTGRVEEEEVDEFVLNDDISTWGSVARGSGVEDERFNMRSRMGPLGRATGSSSSSQHAPHDGDEVDEENDEGYKSCDDDDDGPLLDDDGNANNTGIWDGHSQHAITKAMHVESQVICNDNPSAVFNSFNHFNPQMVYRQYSSVATLLLPSTNANNTDIWDGHSQHDEENDEGYKTCDDGDDGPLLDDYGNANHTSIWDGHSQHAIPEATHDESLVIYNNNPSAVFHSYYDINPQMGYEQYSSVATPLPSLMVDHPLYSPPYYAQASAPNLPHMSSAIPVSPADLIVPENSSMDTMPVGPGSGGTGSGWRFWVSILLLLLYSFLQNTK
ncbi:uncharacterized protein LOC142642941 isoform X3 [Castanea sativa]|uniref:uncharacterized protein LOC142642941 isoform X3 n=1 Tax=Castanea sativa TaxID=21020 RepID=UPI003F64E8B1